MSPEFINTQETGISDDYVYLHCKCEYPLEFAWRFPRTNEEIIFTCPKCKTKIGITAMKMNKPKTENEDMISRKEVLDFLEEYMDAFYNENGKMMYSDHIITNADCNDLKEWIRSFPSVIPQQNTGHWILSDGYWRCSNCREKALLKFDNFGIRTPEYIHVESNYCPNCGAKMIESEDKE